jgi:hypothetical protein
MKLNPPEDAKLESCASRNNNREKRYAHLLRGGNQSSSIFSFSVLDLSQFLIFGKQIRFSYIFSSLD